MKKIAAILLVICLVILAGWFSYPFVLASLAQHLQVQDKLEKVDVIIVLAGDGNGERVAEGIKLYQTGYANKIIMSGGPLAWHLTSAAWMRKQAEASGIPSRSIIEEDRSRSTLDNARFTLPLVKANGYKSAIVISSPFHMRRVARTFNKIFAHSRIKLLYWPVQQSQFNPRRWWTRHEDTGSVVWEYVSLVMYWLKGY